MFFEKFESLHSQTIQYSYFKQIFSTFDFKCQICTKYFIWKILITPRNYHHMASYDWVNQPLKKIFTNHHFTMNVWPPLFSFSQFRIHLIPWHLWMSDHSFLALFTASQLKIAPWNFTMQTRKKAFWLLS